MKKPPRVERDRLRERERQARAQMSSQVADQESPGPSGNFLFREPIRVNPSSADPVTQQIQSKLGDFQRVRHFLDQKDSGLIGVDGVPPSPGGPPPSRHHMPLPPGPVAGAPSRKRQFTWSRELSIKLIQLYESYPCLYLTKPDYHNRNRRNEAYKEICKEINNTHLTTLTSEDVKKEIHELKKQYFSELDKIDKNEASTDLVYKPTLWCFERLLFLNASTRASTPSDSNSQRAATAFQSEAPDAELGKWDAQTTKLQSVSNNSSTSTTSKKRKKADGKEDLQQLSNASAKLDIQTTRPGSAQSDSSVNTISKKRNRLDSRDDMQKLIATDSNKSQNVTGVPAANVFFGEMLANEISNIDDENVVNKLKHDILNLLHEAKKKCRKT